MEITEPSDPQILLVEDDAGLAAMMSDALRLRGYNVRHAGSAAAADLALDEASPDIILLDLMLPDRYGLTLCSELKERVRAPVIICSASRRKDDPAIAELLGADDFLHKPFSLDELQERIELALRRGHGSANEDSNWSSPVHQVGRLRVDTSRCLATIDGEVLQVTPTEFRLLVALASRPHEVVTREELAARIWGHVDADVIRSLHEHTRRLRAKLMAAAPQMRLVSHRGIGYQLADGDDVPAP